jgi:hypothetical protein
VCNRGLTPRKAQTISHVREEPADTEARARYLDFCAARISEVFLSLSDERTYQMMEEAALEAGLEIGSLGFSEMMDLVTQRLRRNVPLPEFEDWVQEYRESPERFNHLFLDPRPTAGGDDTTGDGEE